MRRVVRVVVCTVLFHAIAGLATAATLPPGFTETTITGLSKPTAMAIAPDGRIFVCEQGGAVRVIKNGALLPTPFVSLTVNSDNERGALGIAFDPAFASNQLVYVYYTATTPAIHNRVSRFTANGDVAVPGSEQIILELENLVASNHNGGAIHFGPDGKLYVAVGENAVASNSQTLSNRLGKILRINPDGSIPADNPFFNTPGANQAIWALGLRNPYTFAIDPTVPRMFINDVGEGTFEEINEGAPGANYGWPQTEGPFQNFPNFTHPRFWYATHVGGTCAISGAAFYSPATSAFPPDYAGDYFFADLCAGWIRRLDVATNNVTTFATGIPGPVDLLVANDGSLYYLAIGESTNTGVLVRVRFTSAGGPPAPSLTGSSNGLTLSLSWTASAGATSYHLQAGTSSGGSDLFNENVGNTTAVEGVVPPGFYSVRVLAVGPGGTSGPSNDVGIVVNGSGPCTTPPPVPTGYVAQVQGLNVSLAWNASPSTTFYVLEAGSSSGAADLLQASVGKVTSLSATGPIGTFFTRVRAANTCGVSVPSSEVPIDLTCAITAPTGLRADKAGTIATFAWNAAPGATSYRVLVGSASGLSDLLNAEVGLSTGGPLNTAGVPPGDYFFRVVAQTPCGISAPSNEVTLTVP